MPSNDYQQYLLHHDPERRDAIQQELAALPEIQCQQSYRQYVQGVSLLIAVGKVTPDAGRVILELANQAYRSLETDAANQLAVLAMEKAKAALEAPKLKPLPAPEPEPKATPFRGHWDAPIISADMDDADVLEDED